MQTVFLKLDWSSIKATTDDDPGFDNNDNGNNGNNNSGNGNNGTTGTLPTSTLNNTGSTTGGSKLSGSSLSGTSGSSLKSASSVKTGDMEQNYVLYISIALLGVALAMAGVMSYKKKKN